MAASASEGAIFNWILMNDLKITTKELYVKLKDQGVITVPGEYFFFGTPSHPHYNKCLRINYSRPEDEVREGIKIIADTYKKFCK
jgi:valine--pyruvate aminotransferase